MKILVIQHKAGDRFRTVQYYEALRSKGFEIEDPHWDLSSEWKKYLKKAREVDVVWIARRMLSFYRLGQLKRANPHIVFDYDDALFLRSSRHGARSSFSKKNKFRSMIKAAKCVVAGNDYLAEVARKHVPFSKVYLLPTTVNRDWYEDRKEKKNWEEFTIGWLGSRSTLAYLEKLRPVFLRFNTLGIPWKLMVVSDAFPDWTDLPLEKITWSLEDEKMSLRKMDIGLNPLSDDAWCLGKCALKAIQYMAAGVALVASPVGVNKVLIDNSQLAWSATSDEQWLEAFKEAAADKQATFQRGVSSRKWVWDKYTMESQLDNLITIFEDSVA